MRVDYNAVETIQRNLQAIQKLLTISEKIRIDKLNTGENELENIRASLLHIVGLIQPLMQDIITAIQQQDFGSANSYIQENFQLFAADIEYLTALCDNFVSQLGLASIKESLLHELFDEIKVKENLLLLKIKTLYDDIDLGMYRKDDREARSRFIDGANSSDSPSKDTVTEGKPETDDIRIPVPKPVAPTTSIGGLEAGESPKIEDILIPKPATEEEIFLEDEEEAESTPEEAVLEACQETQFTAFYPRHVNAKQDYMLLVYAHLPDALIHADAEQFKAELGGRVPKAVVADETACLKEGALLTVMIHCDKLKFNQVGAMQQWKAPQTRFDFHFSAAESLVDEIVEGRIAILLGMIEIASIDFQISVGASLEKSEGESSGLVGMKPSVSVPSYQKIFVSYSRKDSIVAEQYRAAQTMLGNTIFMDIHSIRAGEAWEEALKRFISEADVFQLFWSEHSASSEHVRFEWEYALKQRCPETACKQFIRPSYWQKPMPSVPQALGHLHFAYVELAQNSPEK